MSIEQRVHEKHERHEHFSSEHHADERILSIEWRSRWTVLICFVSFVLFVDQFQAVYFFTPGNRLHHFAAALAFALNE